MSSDDEPCRHWTARFGEAGLRWALHVPAWPSPINVEGCALELKGWLIGKCPIGPLLWQPWLENLILALDKGLPMQLCLWSHEFLR